MKIETERLIIIEMNMDMAEAVHKNSLDEDNTRFIPDEVFYTIKEASDTITYLMYNIILYLGRLPMQLLLKNWRKYWIRIKAIN